MRARVSFDWAWCGGRVATHPQATQLLRSCRMTSVHIRFERVLERGGAGTRQRILAVYRGLVLPLHCPTSIEKLSAGL